MRKLIILAALALVVLTGCTKTNSATGAYRAACEQSCFQHSPFRSLGFPLIDAVQEEGHIIYFIVISNQSTSSQPASLMDLLRVQKRPICAPVQ